MAKPIFYASTGDGMVLPVIDVSHPAFEVRTTAAELGAMADQYVREAEARTQQMSPELVEGLKRSRLGRGLMAAANGVLGGIETYMMKVGPENFAPDIHPLDRAIAASFPALTTRLRLQDTAHLVAEGLARVLPAHPGRPLVCLNIGGGAGADSWNALLLVRAAHPELVADRAVTIAILDVDAAGAAFGEKAVIALKTSGGPLSAMTVGVHHVTYDWSNASQLSGLLAGLPADAVCAVSSEGALFEYATDQEIVENLRALRAASPAPATCVGTVTRDSAATRASRASTRVTTIPRSIDAFQDLAAAARWRVDVVLERPFAYSVRLEPI